MRDAGGALVGLLQRLLQALLQSRLCVFVLGGRARGDEEMQRLGLRSQEEEFVNQAAAG